MLRRTITTTLAATLAVAVFGCSVGDMPTGPETTAPAMVPSSSLIGTLTGTVTNLVSSILVSCDKLPQQSASAIIGTGGGTIKIGPHTLVVPAGALQKNTTITAQLPGDKASTVRFLPEGLHFSKPATLTMSYAHCRKLLPLPTRIVYTTENLNILELLRSLDNRTKKTVTAPLDHFSKYAIAYRNSDVVGDEEVGFTEEQAR